MNFDLQLFAEKSLQNQTPVQLRKGIKTFKKRIDEHFAKIKNPEKFCDDWNSYDNEHQEGLIWHWQHEIKNFYESIQNRVEELEKRGEKL